MIIYFALYALLGLTSAFLIPLKDDKKTAKIICIVGFFSISLMLALRHPSMGHDLQYLKNNGYLASFDRIAMVPLENILSFKWLNYEKGFIIFNKIVSLIYKDRQFYLGTCAFLSTLPIAVIIYKKSVAPLQSFMIYLGLPAFLMSYSGLRQALAIGLCFYSIEFIQEKKWIKFILLVLLANTFHDSAWLFLVAYPVYYFKMSKNLRIVSICAIPLVYIFKVPLFRILSVLLKPEASLVDTGALTLFVVFSLIYVFCVIYTDYSEEQNGLLNIYLLACLCQAFGGIYHTAMRVGYYFMTSLVLLLPLLLKNIKFANDKEIFSRIIFICFAVFGLYSIYTSTWAMAYPYYFFWQSI